MTDVIIDDLEKEEAQVIFGQRDEHLRLIRESLGISVVGRDRRLLIHGDSPKAEQGKKVVELMRKQYQTHRPLSVDDVKYFVAVAQGKGATTVAPSQLEITGTAHPHLRAHQGGQARYLDAIRHSDLVFCIGPAGTGKTYVAGAVAVEALSRNQVKRIVLVRPAVEAGEKLGFLPGGKEEKVQPFLMPLLDVFYEMMGPDKVREYLENQTIELAPLAYMRGRTLNNAFIILDEAQNTTIPQMKMFLTRMGQGSKIVVTGDVTQVDLPVGFPSGLDDAVTRLEKIERVSVVRMQKSDIVRHPLVQAIVAAYDEGNREIES